jgi:hypothetical protein
MAIDEPSARTLDEEDELFKDRFLFQLILKPELPEAGLHLHPVGEVEPAPRIPLTYLRHFHPPIDILLEVVMAMSTRCEFAVFTGDRLRRFVLVGAL